MYPGVRGSPTIEGSRVYIQSGQGCVACMNAADGKVLWSVDLYAVFGKSDLFWGNAETMLLFNGRLICTPGGITASVAALDTATGKTVWSIKTGEDRAAYCSPLLVTHNSRPLIVTMLENSVVGIDPVSAKLLWKHEFKSPQGIGPNTPVYWNGNIIYASGDGTGAGILKLSDDASGVTPVWSEKKFDPMMGGMVILGNTLYGFGQTNKGFHALDVSAGKIIHTLKQNKGGDVISCGGMLYCYTEDGTVFLAAAEKSGMAMVSSFKVDKGVGPHFAHLVISGGKLFVRHGAYLLVYGIGK